MKCRLSRSMSPRAYPSGIKAPGRDSTKLKHTSGVPSIVIEARSSRQNTMMRSRFAGLSWKCWVRYPAALRGSVAGGIPPIICDEPTLARQRTACGACQPRRLKSGCLRSSLWPTIGSPGTTSREQGASDGVDR